MRGSGAQPLFTSENNVSDTVVSRSRCVPRLLTPGYLVDGLVAGVDGHVVVLGALDVGPLVLVADTLQQVVGVRDASHALDTEAHLSWK